MVRALGGQVENDPTAAHVARQQEHVSNGGQRQSRAYGHVICGQTRCGENARKHGCPGVGIDPRFFFAQRQPGNIDAPPRQKFGRDAARLTRQMAAYDRLDQVDIGRHDHHVSLIDHPMACPVPSTER